MNMPVQDKDFKSSAGRPLTRRLMLRFMAAAGAGAAVVAAPALSRPDMSDEATALFSNYARLVPAGGRLLGVTVKSSGIEACCVTASGELLHLNPTNLKWS